MWGELGAMRREQAEAESRGVQELQRGIGENRKKVQHKRRTQRPQTQLVREEAAVGFEFGAGQKHRQVVVRVVLDGKWAAEGHDLAALLHLGLQKKKFRSPSLFSISGSTATRGRGRNRSWNVALGLGARLGQIPDQIVALY